MRARGPLARTARTLAAQGLLAAALPANAAVTAAALARSVFARPARAVAEPRRTVLLTGGKMTKSLQLARSFHAAGHRVVLAEESKYRFTGHRFSRAVDRFEATPKPGSPGYTEALAAIVRAEGVDVVVPVSSPASSLPEAQAKPVLARWAEVIHGDADVIATVDDKAAFVASAAALGLDVPESARVISPEDVAAFPFTPGRSYILKSIAYDPVNRLDLTLLPLATVEQTRAFAASKPLSAENPWVLQEFVAGTEYCVHTTVRGGRLRVYCCCESSAFQVNYEAVDRPAVREWVAKYVEAQQLTGQYSFDLIETPAGRVVPIECNPRTHSAITLFHDDPRLAPAYLTDDGPAVTPDPDARPTYWLYHELWRALRHPTSLPTRVRVVRAGRDAIFDPADPLPFLLEHHLQIPLLLWRNLLAGRDWIKIDFNIGKLVEAGGD